jgi:hypothetical protein
MQVRGADKVSGYRNEAAPIYMEFIMRQGLAKLGYTDSMDNLDCFTAECFAIIASEIARITNDKIKRGK